MRRAARIDQNQPDICAALRENGASVLSLAAIGKGCPDLIVFHPAVGYLMVEIKNPAKPKADRQLTPDQVAWHAAWAGPVHIVETVEQAIALITP